MTFDKSLFSSLGISLDATQATAFQKHFEKTLEERVGLAIFDLLDDTEARELIALQQSTDTAATVEWIKAHVPDYEDIVQDEFDILMGEVAENAELVAA